MRIPLRSPRILLSAAVVGIVVLLLLHRFKMLQPAEQLASRGLRPIQSILTNASDGLRRLTDSFGSVKRLRAENDRLRHQIQQLLVDQEAARLNQADAAKVNEALRVLGDRGWQGTVARVIGRSPDPTYRLYLLNRGIRHGVTIGAAVIVGEGIYLGKILESEPESAKFLLLTDPHASMAGQVENDTKTQGLLTGEYGLSLKMDLLAKNDHIETGQTVVTSGLEQGAPRGLVIGRIASVSNAPGDLFQTATVVPAADLRDLDVVTILLEQHA